MLKSYVVFANIQNVHSIAKVFVRDVFMSSAERRYNNRESRVSKNIKVSLKFHNFVRTNRH